MEGCQTYKNSDFHIIFHNATITANLFVIKEILPGMYLTCAIKYFPSILVWAIQIHLLFFRNCSVDACLTIEKQ